MTARRVTLRPRRDDSGQRHLSRDSRNEHHKRCEEWQSSPARSRGDEHADYDGYHQDDNYSDQREDDDERSVAWSDKDDRRSRDDAYCERDRYDEVRDEDDYNAGDCEEEYDREEYDDGYYEWRSDKFKEGARGRGAGSWNRNNGWRRQDNDAQWEESASKWHQQAHSSHDEFANTPWRRERRGGENRIRNDDTERHRNELDRRGYDTYDQKQDERRRGEDRERCDRRMPEENGRYDRSDWRSERRQGVDREDYNQRMPAESARYDRSDQRHAERREGEVRERHDQRMPEKSARHDRPDQRQAERREGEESGRLDRSGRRQADRREGDDRQRHDQRILEEKGRQDRLDRSQLERREGEDRQRYNQSMPEENGRHDRPARRQAERRAGSNGDQSRQRDINRRAEDEPRRFDTRSNGHTKESEDRRRRRSRDDDRARRERRQEERKDNTVAALAPRSSSAAALAALKAKEGSGQVRPRPAPNASGRSRSRDAPKPRRGSPGKEEENDVSKDGHLRWVYVATVPDDARNWLWFKSRHDGVVKARFHGNVKSSHRQSIVEMSNARLAAGLLKVLEAEGLTARLQANADFPFTEETSSSCPNGGAAEGSFARSSPSRPPRASRHEGKSSGSNGSAVDIWAVAGVLAGAASAGAAASEAVASTVDPCWVFVKNLVPEAAKRPLQWFQKKCGGQESSSAPVRGILCAALPGGAADGSAVLLQFSTSSAAESLIAAVDGWKSGVPRMKAQLATRTQTEAVNCCWLLVRELTPNVQDGKFFKKICEGVQTVLFYNEPKARSEINLSTQDSQAAAAPASSSRLALVEVRTPELAAELCAALNRLQQGSMVAVQISEVQKTAIEARVHAAEKEAAAAEVRLTEEPLCEAEGEHEAAEGRSPRHGERRQHRSRSRRQHCSRSRRAPRERSGRRASGRSRSRRSRRPVGSERQRSPRQDRGRRDSGKSLERGRRPPKGEGRGDGKSRRERSWTVTRPGY